MFFFWLLIIFIEFRQSLYSSKYIMKTPSKSLIYNENKANRTTWVSFWIIRADIYLRNIALFLCEWSSHHRRETPAELTSMLKVILRATSRDQLQRRIRRTQCASEMELESSPRHLGGAVEAQGNPSQAWIFFWLSSGRSRKRLFAGQTVSPS